MTLTTNKAVLQFVQDAAELTCPDKVIWIDGSEEQLEELRREAMATGELIKLNEEKLPGCYYHRSALNDVARVEGRTFICTRKQEDCGPTNNWMDPKEAYAVASDVLRGSMKGRTMYVIPFCMGPVASRFAKVGIEITDSIYVVVSMAIMTRVGKAVMDKLGDSNDFVRGLHGKCELDDQKLRDIAERLTALRNLESRRSEIAESLKKLEVWTKISLQHLKLVYHQQEEWE